MKNTKMKDEPESLAGLFGAVIRGAGIGTVTAFALMLALSAASLAAKDPDSLIGWMAMAALLIGALIAGVTAVRSDPGRSLTAGILGGALYVLILWLISLFFRGETANPVTPLAMALWYAGCVLTAFIGGLAGRGTTPRVDGGRHSPAAMARRQLRRK